MTKNRRKHVLRAVILLVVGAIGWWIINPFLPPRGRVRAIAAPGWKNRNCDTLLLRTEESDGGALLLRCLDTTEALRRDYGNEALATGQPAIPLIYHFDPSTKKMTEVGIKEWNSAKGVPVANGDDIPRVRGKVGFDFKTRDLLCDGKPMDSAARTVAIAHTSPDGQLLAVQSTTGSYTKPGMIFGGGANGWLLHEVIRVTDCSRVGPAVPIDYYIRGGSLGATWSADNRFVVYYDPTFFDELFIVPVEAAETVR